MNNDRAFQNRHISSQNLYLCTSCEQNPYHDRDREGSS